MKKRLPYIIAAVILFVAEIIIGLYVKDDFIRPYGGDILITCAYGQILTQDVLDCFEKGVWNIHAGLLPAYRGASPIQSCILNGETQTGVSVMKTDVGLDTGDIVLSPEVKAVR